MGSWNRIAKYVKWLSAYWIEMHGLDTLVCKCAGQNRLEYGRTSVVFKEVYIDCLTVLLRYLLASLKLA